MGRWLPNLCKEAGVEPFQFHSLRHYFAHRLWKNKAPIEYIQLLLGHEDLKTTKIYLSQITLPYDIVKYI